MLESDGLRKLVQRVMADPDLLRAAVADPEGTLAAHGIRLSEAELAAVRDFAGRMAGRGTDEISVELAAALGDRAAMGW